MSNLSLTLTALASAAGLFIGMLMLFEVGRRLGAARHARHPDDAAIGAGPIEAAVFGLLGLLLAFAFSGAASRFEDRRHLIAEEANAIGTAYLRIDLLPADAQPAIREHFRRYLETRIDTYRNAPSVAHIEARLAEATGLQTEIWSAATAACRRPDVAANAPMLLLPALNEIIDITTTRVVATQNHPPTIIFVLLASLSLVSAMLVGYVSSTSKRRTWFYQLMFAATMSLTFYVILDLEFPRLGLIRIDAADQPLLDLEKAIQ